jgi:solute carrier family 13 (sodium-dependent dicarboxylate transporter), member 2/3/5
MVGKNDYISQPVSRRVGFWLGLLFLIGAFFIQPPGELSEHAWRTALVAMFMAVWWMTEAVPIPATSLLPIILFPLFGILSVKTAAAPFGHPLIFLFMGGFILALSMERTGLHRRLALAIINFLGVNPRSVIAGFMIATAFISMWVSNTATTLMMLPIGLSVIDIAKGKISEEESRRFSIVLLLGITYSASVGGLATLIGTPPNALLAAVMQESFNQPIGFVQWMGFGLPISIIGLIIVFIVLNFVLYPLKIERFGGKDFIKEELDRLGSMTPAEKRVAAIFLATAILWMTRPLLQKLIPGISDAGIAITSAMLTFIIPENRPGSRTLMSWSEAVKLPWGILLLFGGGLSLAQTISSSGLSEWIGGQLHGLISMPLFLIVLLAVAMIIFLTELTSNTATAATFLPIIAALAVSLGVNPMLLAAPAAAAATCAFMLPVATPPNAIIYGSGVLNISDMVRAGLILNIVFSLLNSAAAFLLAPIIFK